VNAVATNTISTSTTEVVTSYAGSSGTIPANGYVVAVLSLASGATNHCTIYWGSGQQSNFQMPYRILSS